MQLQETQDKNCPSLIFKTFQEGKCDVQPDTFQPSRKPQFYMLYEVLLHLTHHPSYSKVQTDAITSSLMKKMSFFGPGKNVTYSRTTINSIWGLNERVYFNNILEFIVTRYNLNVTYVIFNKYKLLWARGLRNQNVTYSRTRGPLEVNKVWNKTGWMLDELFYFAQ